MEQKSINMLKQQRTKLIKSLAALTPVIDGSFAEVKVTCGKPNCKCASGEKHKSYKLVKKIQGKSKTTHIPKELVEEVKTWVAENRRLKDVMKESASLSEQIIRLHIKTSRAASRNRKSAAE